MKKAALQGDYLTAETRSKGEDYGTNVAHSSEIFTKVWNRKLSVEILDITKTIDTINRCETRVI